MARDGEPSAKPGRGREAGSESLGVLLRAWQFEGREQALEALVSAALSIVERHARRTLRDMGIRDPAAVDDAVALVFDHVRRLPGGADGERRVAGFSPADTRRQGRSDALAFLRLLTRSRARDVARSLRRRSRRMRPFAALDEVATDSLHDVVAAHRDPGRRRDLCEQLPAAIQALDPRERAAISLRLEGKSLAVLAHVLGICEGTASRIHARAVGKLRAALLQGSSARASKP